MPSIPPAQPPVPPSAAVRARDPDRTRRAILEAARTEFAERGFAGARVDAIATAAGVNKRMLYHYFRHKEGLFAAVFADRMAEPAPPIGTHFGATLAARDDDARSRRETLRLHMWEALGGAGDALAGGSARREIWARQVAAIADGQARGALPADLDAAHLELALLSLAWFPLAFPQLARLVTGHTPDEPEFAAARRAFLNRFAALLGGAPSANSRSAPPPDAPKPRYRLAATMRTSES